MSEDQMRMLIEFTHDDDPRARAMAIAGLAKLADTRGFAAVLVCLFDPVDEVRAAAATALGIFGDDRAFEALVEGLRDPNERVGVNCAWALGQIHTERCFEELCTVAADGGAANAIRAAAVTSIGERLERFGFDATTEGATIDGLRSILHGLLDAEDDELRAASVWTLGHLPAAKETTQLVIEALEDEYEWVVRYAIEALSHFDDLEALDPLLELTESESQEISDLAWQAIDILRGNA